MLGKISIGLNIILAAAVAYLFTQLPVKDDAAKEVTTEAVSDVAENVEKDEMSVGDVRIAYILGDSINQKYQFLIDKQDELIRKGRRSEDKIRREIESAEKRYMEIMQKQQSGGFSSQQEVIDAENELMQLQAKIEELQNSESQSMARLERQLDEEFFTNVQDYLRKYSTENDIDLVVNIQKGGSVLYSNESFDVTSEVLRGLNQEYQAEFEAEQNEK